ncbi:MAG: hypothetical protein ACWA44_13465 [Thiotrichales bacterium]
MYPYRANNHQKREFKEEKNFKSGQSAAHRNKFKKDFASSYYAYGKSAAIEFVCDETKKQRINTITLHAASARTDEERGYDWENKTIVQLPRSELLQVAAILLGLSSKGEFNQTGLHASKSFSVEFQEEKVFFMVMERGKPIRAVGLSPDDTYHVAGLFLKQLKQNSPWLTANEIIDLIELTVVRMQAAKDERISAKAQAGDADDGVSADGDNVEESEDFEEEFEPNFNF